MYNNIPPDLSATLESGETQPLAPEWDLLPHRAVTLEETCLREGKRLCGALDHEPLHTWHTRLFCDFESRCGCVWYDEADGYSIFLYAFNLADEIEEAFNFLCALVENDGSIREFIDRYPGKFLMNESRCSSMDKLMDRVERLTG